MDPRRAQIEGGYVAVLHDVCVETADWSVIDGGRIYNTEAHARTLIKNPFVKGKASPDRETFLMDLPPVARIIDEPCVHIGGDGNYAHWVMRNLLKLALLEDTPHAELPLLINEDLLPHQLEYLRMIGIPESRLIKVPRLSLCTLSRAHRADDSRLQSQACPGSQMAAQARCVEHVRRPCDRTAVHRSARRKGAPDG